MTVSVCHFTMQLCKILLVISVSFIQINITSIPDMIISKIPFISTYLFTILGSLIFILKTSRNQGTLYIKWPLVVNEHKSLLDSEISIHVTYTKHNYFYSCGLPSEGCFLTMCLKCFWLMFK